MISLKQRLIIVFLIVAIIISTISIIMMFNSGDNENVSVGQNPSVSQSGGATSINLFVEGSNVPGAEDGGR